MIPINNLELLQWAALNRRAVVVPRSRNFSHPRPAAFVFNLTGQVLLQLFRSGMYLYEKPTQPERTP